MGLFDIIDDIAEKQVMKTETGDNRIFGVMIGEVVSNYDMNMPGRVCVAITTRDEEANVLKWARVAMPSSGVGWGHYFLPEVGDQVLVAFEQGNIEKPYVIGCVPKDNNLFLRKAVDETNQYKKITTKNGSTITFTDKMEGEGANDKITIETATKGHQIVMDNEMNKILISDRDGMNKIEMKTGEEAGSIEIVAAKRLTIKVGETIELKMNGSNGSTKLTTNKLTVEANGKMKVESTGPMNVTGANVTLASNAIMKLESSGAVQISGAPISVG